MLVAFVVGEEHQNWELKVLLVLLVRLRASSWDVLCLSFQKLGLLCAFLRVVSWPDLGFRIMADCFVQLQIRFVVRIAVSEAEGRSEVVCCQMQD
jgi:hypothetical protein